MAEASSQQRDSSLAGYLGVLRRRKWILITCAILVPAAAFGFSLLQASKYQSSAEAFINKQNIASALTGISDTTLYIDENRAAETQVNLALLPVVAQEALKGAGITDMSVDDLLAESTVASKGTSDILEFKVTDPRPARARRLATAYVRAYAAYRGALDTGSVSRARLEVQRTMAQLEAQGKKGSPLYDTLVAKEQQLATLETLKTSRVIVVRRGSEAVKVAPKPVRNAVLGLVLGLVLGVGLAFAVDALDTRVRDANEVAELLGLTMLARVPPPPKDFGKSDHLVMLARPTGADAEAFRMLRTNLEFARLEGEDMRTILITSAVEREGKSTTAANLAIAEARAGRNVVLVDLDLRRPSIGRYFKLLHASGVTDVALGKVALDEALEHVDLSLGTGANGSVALPALNGRPQSPGRLDVLVTGPLPPDPGEFVGTRKLADILSQLRACYDLVVLDTPPILLVGDAMTLASNADGILLVTKLGVATRPMLRDLHRMLGAVPVPKLGYVVTGSTRGEGYGGGYGGSYYTSAGDRSKRQTNQRVREGETVT